MNNREQSQAARLRKYPKEALVRYIVKGQMLPIMWSVLDALAQFECASELQALLDKEQRLRKRLTPAMKARLACGIRRKRDVDIAVQLGRIVRRIEKLLAKLPKPTD